MDAMLRGFVQVHETCYGKYPTFFASEFLLSLNISADKCKLSFKRHNVMWCRVWCGPLSRGSTWFWPCHKVGVGIFIRSDVTTLLRSAGCVWRRKIVGKIPFPCDVTMEAPSSGDRGSKCDAPRSYHWRKIIESKFPCYDITTKALSGGRKTNYFTHRCY